MPMIFCDGFDQYGNSGEASQVYSSFGQYNTNASRVRTGIASLYMGFANQTTWVFPAPTTQATFGAGIMCTVIGGNDNRCQIAQLGSYALCFNTSQGLSLFDNGGNFLAQTAAKVWSPNSFFWCEFQVDTTGVQNLVSVRVNGGLQLQYSGNKMAQNATIGQWGSFTNNYNGQFEFALDDLVICTGDDVFPGDRRCYTLFPNANTAQADWTPTGVANAYQALGNAPPDPTKYISAMAAGNKSNFSFAALPPGSSSILGISLFSKTSKSDAGTCAIQAGFISGAGQANGVNRAQGTAYTWNNDVITTNPATGSAYTPADINAGLLTISRTA